MVKRRKSEKERAEKWVRTRIYLVSAVFLAFFALVFARAFELQVLKGAELKEMAASQHERTLTVQSRRGDIYDRRGRALAVSLEVDSVYAQPSRVDSPAEAARTLAGALGVKRHEVERALATSRNFVWLKRQVDLGPDEREKIKAIPGVDTVKESRRYYPNRTLASNIIGFTGVDSDGLEGLELHYDNVLRGATRKIAGQRDAAGNRLLFEDVDKKVPLEGMQVELTVDKTVQYIAEKALERKVGETGAKGGVAVVMDPFTGEVLASAVRPTFDPNDYKRYSPSDWRNRSVTDVYEPGSIFKLFMISAALEEDVVEPGEIIYCENGRYRVADRVFHDTKRHGWLTVPQIIKYSSNIGSAKIGERVGPERLYRYLRSFGFGEKTGVDLPGESRGMLRHYSRWSAVTVDTVSFGQGVSATAMQLVTALSSIANGGYLMKPFVVKSVKDPDGGVISESHPVVVRRVISQATARRMTEVLTGVTREGGTGTQAAIPGFEVAGKTATAQKPDLKGGGYKDDAYVSSFFGYVPARNPRLAILVSIDEPAGDDYHGGQVAGPVFREIASQTLAYMGLYPAQDGPRDVPSTASSAGFAEPAGTFVRASAERIIPAGQTGPVDSADEAGPGVVPDFTGQTMREVLREASALSLEVEPVGSGRAARQKPRAGRSPGEGGRVTVWFR